MGKLRAITFLTFALNLAVTASANAPPPPPPPEVQPFDAVTTVFRIMSARWALTFDTLVGPQSDPKQGTLELTPSGRYFLTYQQGANTLQETEQGIWAVWDAAEGGAFVLTLIPIVPGENKDLKVYDDTARRWQLNGDGAGGYKGEAGEETHFRQVFLRPL